MLDFDVEQVYSVEYLLVLKIEGDDMMHFLFFMSGKSDFCIYFTECIIISLNPLNQKIFNQINLFSIEIENAFSEDDFS
jgi:hypothetical protein